jgi:hypothetical protein
MIDEAYDDADGGSGTWRTIALVSVAGIGAWFAWRWLSRSDAGRDLGARVREGVERVKEQVGEWTGQDQEPEPSEVGGIDGIDDAMPPASSQARYGSDQTT